MTALTALLAARDLSPEEAALFVAMMQNASINGTLRCSEEELFYHYRRMTSTRPTGDTLRKVHASLLEKELIPSLEATYPLNGQVEDMPQEELQTLIQRIEEDFSLVRPDPASPQYESHKRVFAALVAIDAVEVAARTKREALADPATGRAVVSGGTQHQAKRQEWDYGFVGKLISKYTLEKVISTLCQLHASGSFKKLHHTTYQEKRGVYRRFIIGALEGTSTVDRRGIARKKLQIG